MEDGASHCSAVSFARVKRAIHPQHLFFGEYLNRFSRHKTLHTCSNVHNRSAVFDTKGDPPPTHSEPLILKTKAPNIRIVLKSHTVAQSLVLHSLALAKACAIVQQLTC